MNCINLKVAVGMLKLKHREDLLSWRFERVLQSKHDSWSESSDEGLTLERSAQ